jgi:hypothetical protein
MYKYAARRHKLSDSRHRLYTSDHGMPSFNDT